MMTVLERLPEGWQWARLGDVLSLQRQTVNPKQRSDLRYVGLEHMDPGKPRIVRWGRPDEVRSAKSSFLPADILYGKLRPYLDKSALAEWPGMCSTDVLVLRPREAVDPVFMSYAMHTNRVIDHAVATTAGVNHPRTSWAALQKLELPMPPLPEQRAIAHVLRTVQQGIEGTETVIGATRELKKSLMRHLFAYGPVPVDAVDSVPLKETEIGAMPPGWRVTTIGDEATLQRGFDITKREQRQGLFPVVSSGGIFSHHDSPKVPGPGVVIGRKGTLGTAFYIEKPFWPHDTTLWVKDFHANDPRFVYYFFQSFDVSSLNVGASNPTLNRNHVHPVQVAWPPLHDQMRIGMSLAAADAKTEAELRRKRALETLLKGLLRDLMSGRVRASTGGAEVASLLWRR